MRTYFKELLQNLHIITGLRQVEKLSQSDITKLLDELVKVSNRFGNFPDEKKRSVIDKAILADPDLKVVTPSKIFQYLSSAWENLDPAQKDKYINKREEVEHEPADPETAQKWIDEWKKEFNNIDFSRLDPVKHEIRVMKKEHPQQASKIKLKDIDCPGHIENNQRVKCKAPDYCNGCNGVGRIKISCK